MNKQQLDEVLYCLSEERQIYHYFKDKYCLFLLQQYITETTKIQDLKRSPLSHLCHKPIVKNWLATMGSKYIAPEHVATLWATELHHFTLTLGSWGGDRPEWQQTCRKGHNLVLQLNFPQCHDRQYQKMIAEEYDLFSCCAHPIHADKKTMAWARLDISEDFSEVLIEELQNDWLRYAKDTFESLKTRHDPDLLDDYGLRHWHMFEHYYQQFIVPLQKIWEEAMLCATIEYIHDHLGIKHIYLYEHDTGIALKHMDDWHPPKSLYSKLPKKFGFQLTQTAPIFIQTDHYAAKKLRKFEQRATAKWYFLNLNKEELQHAC